MALARGTVQVGAGIDAGLMAAVRAFARARGQSIRFVLEESLRRHLADPPAVTSGPAPPVTPPPPRRRKRG